MSISPIMVNLGSRSYRIYFNADWGEVLNPLKTSRGLIVTDENVAAHHLGKWSNILPEAEIFIVPPGDGTKSALMLDRIHTFMIEKGFDRGAVVFALGGGMVGDLAGFAAATYMRGVRLAQIPTTLLAMVDASIGGKVGINHRLGKNLIGAFHQPQMALVDTAHLDTLPRREWLCGLGEVLKYGIIRDEALFHIVAERIDSPPESWVSIAEIRRCTEIKAEIVSRDELETSGEREILNFGHTIAHALEAAGDYDIFRHGEAVAAGMAGAAKIASDRGILPGEEYDAIISTLEKFPLPKLEITLEPAGLLEFVRRDKKRRGGRVRMILPVKIGEVLMADDIADEEMMSALAFTLEFIAKK